ncbi:SpoIVB peptidase S55 domain-containing protein [uncultured Mitsuokella sp.]|uniref:SpoIVB peptidase S55 domain-containing protein n=1 Tax=uncultured Mitsuokella sp. TaxID=453120 RepID=UPI002617D3E4|nr:SpoIVB peptidase S55 domain-containing protein [uncultured Mitsuokella sp.]
MKRFVVAGAMTLLFASAAAPARAMDPILPFQDVQQGMSGTAYTVVDSSGIIRSFDVDIVGNMDNGKGSSRMIMARARGPVIEQAGGILQGMSGSPVYIDGRLVGAVAAGIKDMTPYTFFITPIEDMTPLWSMPDTKNKTHLHTINLKKVAADKAREEALAKEEARKKETKGDNVILNRMMDVIKEARDDIKTRTAEEKASDEQEKPAEKADAAEAKDTAAAAEEGKAEETAAEAASSPSAAESGEGQAAESSAQADTAAAKPVVGEKKDVLFLSGFNQAGIDFLQKNVSLGQKFSLMPMGAPGSGDAPTTRYDATLEPGSAVGVAIVYGDFAVGATGTVTAVDGKNILAFGHPFLHRGNVNYFMTDAKVVGTISGQSNGMKIANIGNIIGRINQDRETGIAGRLGDFPSVVPVKVRVKDTGLNRDIEYGARIAYDEDFLPELSGGIAYAAMSKTSDTLGGSTANVHFTIRTNATSSGRFERSNMFYNVADVGQIAVGELMQAMNIICSNPEQESDIVDVQVDISMESGRKTATLLSAVPDKTVVHPGETVRFTTTIKPYRRDKETLLIPYRVPDTAPEGLLSLEVRGGGVMPVTQLKLLQQTGLDLLVQEDKTQTTKDKLQSLKQAGRNNDIVIAPGASPVILSEKEQRKAVKEATAAAKRAAEEAKNKPRKFSFSMQKKAEQTGETKFTTNYIIDNVIHTSLQVERK